jgi:hypothetical protein
VSKDKQLQEQRVFEANELELSAGTFRETPIHQVLLAAAAAAAGLSAPPELQAHSLR